METSQSSATRNRLPIRDKTRAVLACLALSFYDLKVRIQTLRGAKLEESVLESSNSRARPVIRVLEEGLDAAAMSVRAEAGAIYVGHEVDSLRCIAAFGPEAKRVLDAAGPLNRALAKRTMVQRRTLVVTRPDPDPQFLPRSSRRTEQAALVRLHDTALALGMMQLVNPQHPLGAHEARLLAGLARTVTTSLIQTMSLRHQEVLAAHDPLTGLRNVRELDAELGRAVGAARRSERDMALMFVDVDHLKRLNSKLGHAAGSEALRRTGKALDEATAGVGSVFRFGGDEFVVVQRHASKESARALADHLRSHVAASTAGPMRPTGELPRVTVSVGVATLSGLRELNGQAPSNLRARLMTTADRALYRAKAEGRNRVVMATTRDDRL